jgi:hypothetical protein
MAETIVHDYEEQTDIGFGRAVRKTYSGVRELLWGKTYKEDMLQEQPFRLSRFDEIESKLHFELYQGLEPDKIYDTEEYLGGFKMVRLVPERLSSGTQPDVHWTIRLVPIQYPSTRPEMSWRQYLTRRLGVWGVVTACLGIGYIGYGLTAGTWPLAVFGALISSIVLVRSLGRKRKDDVSETSRHSSLPTITPMG